MIDIFTTNDPVRLNFAETVLREAGVQAVTIDENTSAVFGGALPWVKRRIMVREVDGDKARVLLEEALPQAFKKE